MVTPHRKVAAENAACCGVYTAVTATMSEHYRTTSDYITVADTDLAAQLVDEYVTDPELTLALNDDVITLSGEWIFAVQHESNVDDTVIGIEPEDNINFLADLARIADSESLPFTITEICQGTLDQHPGMARYTVTADEITMTYDGPTKTWAVANHGIVTTRTDD